MDAVTTPAAPATSAPAGTPAAVTTPAAGTNGTPAPGAPVRGPDGKFTSANGTPAPAPVEPAAPRRIKFKVGDKDEEHDESTVVANFQKGRNAAQLLTEADKRRAAAEERDRKFEEEFAKDPVAALEKRLGKEKFRPSIEKYLHGEFTRDEMTPEQKRLTELENENKSFRQQQEDAKKKAEEDEFKAEQAEYRTHLEGVLQKSLEIGALPANERAIKRAAAVAQRYWKLGIELNPKQIGDEVKAEIREDMGDILTSMTPAQRLDWLEEMGLMTDIRKEDVTRWRTKRGQPAPAAKPAAPAATTEKKHLTLDEFRKSIGD